MSLPPSLPDLKISLQTFFVHCGVLFFQVAIKSIRKDKIKDEQDLVHIRREIEIMSAICHPHIITIYEGTAGGTDSALVCVCVRVCVSHVGSQT